MKKKPVIEHSKILKMISLLPDDKISNFLRDINLVTDSSMSQSKFFRSAQLMYDLYKIYDTDHCNLFLEYKNLKSQKDKVRFRYGNARLVEYEESLKNRPISENRYNGFSKDYWIQKGLSEEDATIKVSEIQSNNARKRKSDSYKDTKKKLKFCTDYWISLGYSLEESEILRKPYLVPMDCSLEGFIFRYGNELGMQKYTSSILKRKQTSIDNMENRKSGGYVSKESLKFFIPLYKFCRKIGIPRDTIYLGVSGSKEFFIRDNSQATNTGKFYDFTISKIGVIIEYNGCFWHARLPEEWKNTFVDYQTSLDADLYKKNLAENFGFQYHIIWSDDNKSEKLEYYKNLIYNLWNQYDNSTKL